MNGRLAQRLTGLYPPAWRARYGEEFEAFLETHPSTLPAICDVIGCAIRERLVSFGGFNMEKRQQSLVLMAYAYLAAIAGGVNFYWTVADTPLATAMHSHAALLVSWILVSAGSLLALAAVVVAAVPLLVATVRSALATGRWNIIGRLAVPPCAAVVAIIWILAAGACARRLRAVYSQKKHAGSVRSQARHGAH